MNNSLDFGKKIKNKLRTKPGLLSHRTWEQSVWNKAIVIYGFNRALKSLKSSSWKTTSCWHAVLRCLCRFSPVIFDWLYWKCKTGLLTFCCIITLTSGTIDNYCIMEYLKKTSRTRKNIRRIIYHKNHDNFENSKPRVQFYLVL